MENDLITGKKVDVSNPADKPATRRQLWALYCITKKDYRGKGLTMQEASNLISELGGKGKGKAKAGAKKSKQPIRKFGIELYNRITEKDNYVPATDIAKLMREELKEKFPLTKFSVRTDSCIDVSWVDGETEKEVKAVVGKYKGEGFDGMIDMRYRYKHAITPDGRLVILGTDGTTGSAGIVSAWKEKMPEGAKHITNGNDFVFTRRSFSENKCYELHGEFNLHKQNPSLMEQIEHWGDQMRSNNRYQGYKYSENGCEIWLRFDWLSDWDYEKMKKMLEIQGLEISRQKMSEEEGKGEWIILKSKTPFESTKKVA